MAHDFTVGQRVKLRQNRPDGGTSWSTVLGMKERATAVVMQVGLGTIFLEAVDTGTYRKGKLFSSRPEAWEPIDAPPPEPEFTPSTYVIDP